MSSAPSIAGSHPNDFADWLSPLMVKELRQGLRSRSFLVTFLFAQVGMVVLTMLQVFVASTARIPHGIHYIIAKQLAAPAKAALFVFLVCALLPIRSWLAMREERRFGSLELLTMASMSAQRLVMGKWKAHLHLMLILSLSLLPYTLLDWFFGGMEIPLRVAVIAWCLLESALAAAAAIYAATHSSAAQVLIIVFSLPLFALTLGILEWCLTLSSGGAVELWLGVSCNVVVISFLCSCYLFAAINRLDRSGTVSPAIHLVSPAE